MVRSFTTSKIVPILTANVNADWIPIRLIVQLELNGIKKEQQRRGKQRDKTVVAERSHAPRLA